jgi:hypothetical protein
MLVGSVVSLALPAFSDSDPLRVKVVPKKSHLNDHNVFVKGKFREMIGNDVQTVTVTIGSHTMVFDKDGNVLTPDPAFGDPRVRLTIEDDNDDPYENDEYMLRFWAPVAKSELGVGTFIAHVEVVTLNGTFVDEASFEIRPMPFHGP